MKLEATDIGEAHVGCLCALSWSGSSFGFTGHSSRGGLEGSGTVSSSNFLVGRLCDTKGESLTFLTALVRTHANNLAWSLGPHYSLGNDPYSVKKEAIYGAVYLNPTEGSSSIRQYLQRKDRGSTIWLFWPRVKRHWNEL